MNIQYAVTRPHGPDERYRVYVLEVNPRASRTVPFVSKATGVSWARVAAKVMAGVTLGKLDIAEHIRPDHTSVKESVFPFGKFPGVDVILGPEMRSTGEAMGMDADFAVAFAKSQMGALCALPTEGNVFLSVRDSDKPHVDGIAQQLAEMGFNIYCTAGTHKYLADRSIDTHRIKKISEGRPNLLDMMRNGQLDLIINTPTRKGMATDEGQLRAAAVRFNVPLVTTMAGAEASVRAIAALRSGRWGVRALQDYYPHYATGAVTTS